MSDDTPAHDETTRKPRKGGLGRGLEALLGDAAATYGGTTGTDRPVEPNRIVPIARLHPSPVQPRRHFNQEALDELATSIAAHGLLQPILVRPAPDDPERFEIIAGERRWRAAQQVPLHEVPVVIRELGDAHALEIALIENLQRQDLSAIEEAEGFRRLVEEFDYSQEALAHTIGRSRSHVANTLRLLTLPERVRALVQEGTLTAGHARALVVLADPVPLAEQAAMEGWSVREIERRAALVRKADATKASTEPDPDTRALERDLSDRLGLAVSIRQGRKGGRITLRYGDLDQLDDLIRRLTGPAA